jgi:tripartite-type tricarboxylate transporter receptor subunit TctC
MIAAAACTLGIGSPVHAQSGGAVTIVVPSSPGSGPDVIARLIAQRLSPVLKANVIVDNKAGANGIIGASFVAKSPPNGKTLMLYDRLTLAVNPLLFSRLPYDPEALTGIADIATVDLLFAVRSDAPYQTWNDMVSYARAHPGKVTVGTAGRGSVHHLSLALIERHYGIDLVDVPYKGIAPAVAGLLGGELGGVISGQETVLNHIQAGKLRVLAVGSTQRSPLLPDVPTLKQVGASSDLLVSTSFGLFGPSKMAPDAIAAIYSAVATVLKDESLISNLAGRGLVVRPSTGADLQDAVTRDRNKFAKLIQDAGIKVE